MNEDELIKKIENARLPEIEVASHRRRLKEALMATASIQKHPGKLNIAESFFARVTDALLPLFASPRRRAAVSFALAVVIIGLVMRPVWIARSSPVALASGIAEGDSELQTLLSGGGKVSVLDVAVDGSAAHLVCTGATGDLAEVDVDLEARIITRRQRLEGIFLAELGEEARRSALSIALTDPRVREIFASGGSVRRVLPSFSSLSGVSVLDGRYTKLHTTPEGAIIQLELNGRSWLVQTNLEEEKVERVIEPERRYFPRPASFSGFRPL